MPHRVEMWRTLRRLVTATAVIVGLWLLVVVPIERAITKTHAGVERGLDKVLSAVTHSDTRITEGRAEITETKEIAELSLLEMRMSATRTIERGDHFLALPLGTKKLIVRGYYKVKGGYQLQPGISLRMEKGQPVARFPRAKILSVELIDFDVLSEEDGWLNRVQPEDRSQILRELRTQMRLEATQSGMLDTVEATLKTRLRDLLDADSVTIEQEIP